MDNCPPKWKIFHPCIWAAIGILVGSDAKDYTVHIQSNHDHLDAIFIFFYLRETHNIPPSLVLHVLWAHACTHTWKIGSVASGHDECWRRWIKVPFFSLKFGSCWPRCIKFPNFRILQLFFDKLKIGNFGSKFLHLDAHFFEKIFFAETLSSCRPE